MDKVIFYIKPPGLIFVDHKEKLHRTPIRLVINKNQISLYKTLVKRVTSTEYEILEVTEKDLITKKQQKLSMIKPKLDISMNLKIEG